MLAKEGCRYVHLRVSPYIATYLRHGWWSLRRRWSYKYKLRIKVTADSSIGMIDVHYLDKRGEKLVDR